ncbi:MULTISPECIES: hypothetical protein [Oceanobacillus]|uniref:Uncharacterized protein n=1 Tax=Oceanobacillus aidingensis TaxID=645964 RepID=A0ABV9JXR5_9BACI|nr:hypothetical protein [Oceanobacillus oncorhynchi]MDM8101684.1 hypothetical protein [Oceanobacillus oncorhynchi]UUI41319.1 hypothetical protein NP440_07160 [Oceanobacillus oncorhynchi]
MDNKTDEFHHLPRWFQRIIPLLSIILSILSFSYVMHLYSLESLVFAQWIRFIIFSLISVVFILAAIIYFFNGALAWNWFIGGFGLLPILLLLQLIIFLLTIVRTAVDAIFQGSLPEPVRTFIDNYPSKFDVVILAVLFIAGVIWMINKLRNKKG